MQHVEVLSSLAQETLKGLTSKPKSLSSKFFYDDNGSRIFQKIMRMPEYYLTDCEFEIFKTKSYDIVQNFARNRRDLEIVELGAGDGVKTTLLLNELQKQAVGFRYFPIDISEEILLELESNLKKRFSSIRVEPKVGDYFDMMEEIEKLSHTPKVILFLGSNIGNFSTNESLDFFRHLRSIIREHDMLFIGFDLKKDPGTILNAYNDKQGHTRDFNINLLHRINKELGANFNLSNFIHSPTYDPLEGIAKSYLVSTKDQDVYISELDKTISFRKWEAIYTEMSKKFDIPMIEHIAKTTGFKVAKNFTDSRGYFVNSLWETA